MRVGGGAVGRGTGHRGPFVVDNPDIIKIVTPLATTPAHPLVEKYQSVLDAACEALATRSYYSRYPESPSPKVYGETRWADRKGMTGGGISSSKSV